MTRDLESELAGINETVATPVSVSVATATPMIDSRDVSIIDPIQENSPECFLIDMRVRLDLQLWLLGK
ncbi:hypothetical protein OAF37_00085 [Rubripirellula sp.]|nr:hypothetical protein [Rubripirellula sp.]MDB4532805.1 hypothetical protein [bacterium]MDB4644430.1 hypothetical protein [Rubripirellula sp.]